MEQARRFDDIEKVQREDSEAKAALNLRKCFRKLGEAIADVNLGPGILREFACASLQCFVQARGPVDELPCLFHLGPHLCNLMLDDRRIGERFTQSGVGASLDMVDGDLQRRLGNSEVCARHSRKEVWSDNLENVPDLIACFTEDLRWPHLHAIERHGTGRISAHAQTVPLPGDANARRIAVRHDTTEFTAGYLGTAADTGRDIGISMSGIGYKLFCPEEGKLIAIGARSAGHRREETLCTR